MGLLSFTCKMVALAIMINCATCTPLDDYVNTLDPTYSYTYLSTHQAPGVTAHVLNMTSQKWLTTDVTTNPVWWHYLAIIVPKTLTYTDTALLYITGGNNYDPPPTLAEETVSYLTVLSETTGTIAAVLSQIPNQPIIFQDDLNHTARMEDAIIAWTWMKFMNNGSNPEILLELPMTKAVVRGMDTINSFAKGLTGINVTKFFIGGMSKRGWVTWTTAAVDKRVIGMAPTVMDLLNIQKNLHHHFRSLGGWTFALKDYYDLNFTSQLDSPNMVKLQAIIDPLSYNSRYAKIPKLIVTCTGDEYFLLDDSYYFFDQLQGPKYLRKIPNAGHSLDGHKVSYFLSLRSFYQNVLENIAFPKITWVLSQTGAGGKISVNTSVKPSTAIVYRAHTTDNIRRDFRLQVKGATPDEPLPHVVIWFNNNANKISNLQYEFELQRPATGWGAFFIQFTFDTVKNSTLEFSTQVNIIPDILPFLDCSGKSCRGTLV